MIASATASILDPPPTRGPTAPALSAPHAIASVLTASTSPATAGFAPVATTCRGTASAMFANAKPAEPATT